MQGQSIRFGGVQSRSPCFRVANLTPSFTGKAASEKFDFGAIILEQSIQGLCAVLQKWRIPPYGLDHQMADGVRPSSKNLVHHLPMHIREPELTALVSVGQAFVIETQALKNRGLKIVNLHLVLDNVESHFVSGAVSQAGLDAAACQPHGECRRMMVAVSRS